MRCLGHFESFARGSTHRHSLAARVLQSRSKDDAKECPSQHAPPRATAELEHNDERLCCATQAEIATCDSRRCAPLACLFATGTMTAAPMEPCRDRIQPFLTWMQANGVTMQSMRLVAHDEAQADVAMHTTAGVADGDTICIIPKTAVLSTKTSSISDIIELEKLGGGLGLVFAVMHEQALGSASKWSESTPTAQCKCASSAHSARIIRSSPRASKLTCRHGYMEHMPAEREFLPVFWPERLLQLAASGGLDMSKAAADIKALEEDYEMHIAPVVARHPDRCVPERMTLRSFQSASSWVSSRAFYVDAHHGAWLP